MTIQKEPPGLWFAFCDHKGCATVLEDFTDPDNSFTEAIQELRTEHDWEVFRVGLHWQHWCPDHEESLEDIARKGARG